MLRLRLITASVLVYNRGVIKAISFSIPRRLSPVDPELIAVTIQVIKSPYGGIRGKKGIAVHLAAMLGTTAHVVVGPILAIVLAILGLFAFPVGTVIGVLIIWYLLKEDVRQAFELAYTSLTEVAPFSDGDEPA
jgi:hypothetical protein